MDFFANVKDGQENDLKGRNFARVSSSFEK